MRAWILSASVLIVLVAGLRAALKGRADPRLTYGLWLLVLLRLLCPLSFFSSPVSLLNVLESAPAAAGEPSAAETAASPSAVPGGAPVLEASPAVSAPSGTAGAEPSAGESGGAGAANVAWTDILGAIWLLGAGVLGLVMLLSNLRFACRLRRERRGLDVPSPAPVYVSALVETPCLFGLFRPAIYLTPGLEGDALRHVLAHENTHRRHGDHVWAALRCLCLALHWYNPLVWLAAALSRQDAELACDAGAVALLGEEQRADYGRTLIGLSCAKPSVLCTATTMNGGKRSLKERILLLARRPKTAVYTLILALLLAGAAAVCTFTGAEKEITGADLSAAAASAPEWAELGTLRGPNGAWGTLYDSDRERLAAVLGALEEEALTPIELQEVAAGMPEYLLEAKLGGYTLRLYFSTGSGDMDLYLEREGYASGQWRTRDGALAGFCGELVELFRGCGENSPFTWPEEVTAITVSAAGGYGEAYAVAEAYMADMEEWLRTFRLQRRVTEDVTPPGAESYTITVTYAGGATESSGVDICTWQGADYFLQRGDFPDCWYALFGGEGSLTAPQAVQDAAAAWAEELFSLYAGEGYTAWRVAALENVGQEVFENDLPGEGTGNERRFDLYCMTLELYHPGADSLPLAGGMYVTADGWVCPDTPHSRYFLYEPGSGQVCGRFGCPDSSPGTAAFRRELVRALAQQAAGVSLRCGDSAVSAAVLSGEYSLHLWADAGWINEGASADAGALRALAGALPVLTVTGEQERIVADYRGDCFRDRVIRTLYTYYDGDFNAFYTSEVPEAVTAPGETGCYVTAEVTWLVEYSGEGGEWETVTAVYAYRQAPPGEGGDTWDLRGLMGSDPERFTQLVETWKRECGYEGLTVTADTPQEAMTLFAEAAAARYTAEGNPALSADNPALCTESAVYQAGGYLQELSLTANPRRLCFSLSLVLRPVDEERLQFVYFNSHGLADGPYAGWTVLQTEIVLESGDGRNWSWAESNSGGSGGWGWVSLKLEPENLAYGLSGDGGSDFLLRFLPTLSLDDWAALSAEEVNTIAAALEESAAGSDQLYRDLYVMKCVGNTDGAYTELLAGTLAAQRTYDPAAFAEALTHLSGTEREAVEALVQTAS